MYVKALRSASSCVDAGVGLQLHVGRAQFVYVLTIRGRRGWAGDIIIFLHCTASMPTLTLRPAVQLIYRQTEKEQKLCIAVFATF